MSLTARSRSIPGTLRQEIVIDGKHRLITDEPECIGGECGKKTGSSTKSPSTSTTTTTQPRAPQTSPSTSPAT